MRAEKALSRAMKYIFNFVTVEKWDLEALKKACFSACFSFQALFPFIIFLSVQLKKCHPMTNMADSDLGSGTDET